MICRQHHRFVIRAIYSNACFIYFFYVGNCNLKKNLNHWTFLLLFVQILYYTMHWHIITVHIECSITNMWINKCSRVSYSEPVTYHYWFSYSLEKQNIKSARSWGQGYKCTLLVILPRDDRPSKCRYVKAVTLYFIVIDIWGFELFSRQ